MRNGFDFLVGAQSVESMKDLDEEAVVSILQSENSFDVSSRLCERLAFLIYQDCDFGLYPPLGTSEKVLEIINGLCKSRIISGIPVEGETFVGSSNASGCPSHANERVLYAMLLSSSKADIPPVLCSFADTYPSSASFAQKLLNNDDRFLTTMLVLLPQIGTIPRDSVFHPVSVFLEALHLINYDSGVFIEWLNSELAACSLLYRVIKSNLGQETQKMWKDYVPIVVDQSKKVKRCREELRSCDSDVITLRITEIVGNEERTKSLNFCGQESKTVHYSEPIALQNSGSFSRWVSTVDDLRQRLRRLHDAKLVADKFKLILTVSDKFCATNLKK